MNVIDLTAHRAVEMERETVERTRLAIARKAETVQRANLEWILADLMADIEAA